MKEPAIFTNPEFGNIRTLETEDGKVLFCASDVARSLGYSRPNDAIRVHCRCTAKHSIPHPQSPDKTIEMSFIPEGDVYRLIVHSKLPNAVKFESWVFDEVLPTIRKTGSYGTQNLSPMLQYLIQMEQKQNALESRQDELEEKLEFNQTEVIKATMAYGRIGILQRKEISKAVRLRTIELCHFANVYESVGKRVVNSIYKALQKHFDVPSYMDITLSQYTDAIVFIKDYTPDAKLAAAISNAMPKPDFTLLNELLRAGDDVIHDDVDD